MSLETKAQNMQNVSPLNEPQVTPNEARTEVVEANLSTQDSNETKEEKSVEEIAAQALEQLTDNWYFAYEGQRFGPLNQNHLVLKLTSLEKPEKILLWKKGLKDWRPLFEFPEILNRLNEKLDGKEAA